VSTSTEVFSFEVRIGQSQRKSQDGEKGRHQFQRLGEREKKAERKNPKAAELVVIRDDQAEKLKEKMSLKKEESQEPSPILSTQKVLMPG
jgi:hypothetical protein